MPMSSKSYPAPPQLTCVSPPARPMAPLQATGTVALIAHDAKKEDLIAFARRHRDCLATHRLVATGTTGRLLSEEIGLPVEALASGPVGGDLQIGARIVEGAIAAVIFFRDPLSTHPHSADVQALLKICDVCNVPAATNPAGAELLLMGLAAGSHLGVAQAS
jgi:methylglyoxal synthase